MVKFSLLSISVVCFLGLPISITTSGSRNIVNKLFVITSFPFFDDYDFIKNLIYQKKNKIFNN